MDLIINQMMEFQVVHITDGNRILKGFAGPSVAHIQLAGAVDGNARPLGLMRYVCFQIVQKLRLDLPFIFLFEAFPVCVDIVVCHFQHVLNVCRAGAIENRCCNMKSEGFAGKSQMNLQNLSDIHTAGNAQGVQHDVQRTAIGKERHVFYRKNA